MLIGTEYSAQFLLLDVLKVMEKINLKKTKKKNAW